MTLGIETKCAVTDQQMNMLDTDFLNDGKFCFLVLKQHYSFQVESILLAFAYLQNDNQYFWKA